MAANVSILTPGIAPKSIPPKTPKINIPIVFDYHHHKFCDGGLSEEEALELALSTWPKNIKPVVHYSESKSLHENNNKIGELRSGCYSPHFGKVIGIAMIMKPFWEVSQTVKIEINKQTFDGKVCDLPFI